MNKGFFENWNLKWICGGIEREAAGLRAATGGLPGAKKLGCFEASLSLVSGTFWTSIAPPFLQVAILNPTILSIKRLPVARASKQNYHKILD